MAKNRKHRGKAKKLKPDQVIHHGPIQHSRYGNAVITQNNLDPDQHLAMINHLASRHGETVRSINEHIESVIKIIEIYQPISLMKMAYGTMGAKAINKESESDWSREESSFVYALEYIQSILASHRGQAAPQREISQDVYENLALQIGEIYNKISLEYALTSAAIDRLANPGAPQSELEYLRHRCLNHWVNVRNSRYMVHQREFLMDLLLPHDSELSSTLGIGAKELVDNIEIIANKLTYGIGDAAQKLIEIQKIVSDKYSANHLLESGDKTVGLPLDATLKAEGLYEEFTRSMEDFHGNSLFKITNYTNLPKNLLDELSWEIGAEVDFLSEGDFKGWPLRVLPIRKRPFLKINNDYYCYSAENLFEVIYGLIRKLVLAKNPGYENNWKIKQTEVTESKPLEIFSQLLPNATILKSVHYQWPPTSNSNQNWCECDGVVIFNDALFIIEIRGGGFTPGSPIDDFDSYLKSIENLVLKPLKQSKRLKEYLKSKECVPLFQKENPGNYRQVYEINASLFRIIIECGITREDLMHISSNLGHIVNSLNQQSERDNRFWSLSISDLMILRDIVRSPHTFMHYANLRYNASQRGDIFIYDEVDHLGVYIQINDYILASKDMQEVGGRTTWNGYGRVIDAYFHSKLIGDDPPPPRQSLPNRIQQIIDFLDSNSTPSSLLASYTLLSFGQDSRDGLSEGIDSILLHQTKYCRLRSFSINGDLDLSIYCSIDDLRWSHSQILDNAYPSCFIHSSRSRVILHLSYDSNLILMGVDCWEVSWSNLTAEEKFKYKFMAESIAEDRVKRSLNEKTKIGRNEFCPCGSGLKYKRCHGKFV